MKISRNVVGTLVICLMALSLAYSQDDETKLKGLITGRTGDSMMVQESDGTKHVVVLTDDTKVRTPKGLGLRHNEESWTSLIPGLPVSVKGEKNEKGQIVASQVDFSKENLQTASMIQAGLKPTQQDVQTNQQNISQNQKAIATNQQDIGENKEQISDNEQKTNDRFKALTDYDVKSDMSVYFTPGDTKLSDKDKAALSKTAADATKLSGYLIEVLGFADSTGNAAMNQTLSRDRAEAVIEYLMQECNVSARHILAPGAMGISNPVGSNETTQGRAENRRVQVKVMLNKAAGMSGE